MQQEGTDVRAQWANDEAEAWRAMSKAGVSKEALLSQSGLEFMSAMRRGDVPPPPLCPVLGFVPIEVEAGRCLFQGTPKFDYYNPLGTVHGGWIATLLDSCVGCAVHTSLPVGRGYTTLELKINFLRAITADSGPVRAEGKVISIGRQVGVAEGRLFDSSGRLYAHATTTCLIFDLPKVG